MTIVAEDRALIQQYLEPDRPSAENVPLSSWVDAPMLEAIFSCGADDVRVVADRVRQNVRAIVADLERHGDKTSISTTIAFADRSLAFEVRAGLALIADNRSLKSAERLRAFELWKENLS